MTDTTDKKLLLEIVSLQKKTLKAIEVLYKDVFKTGDKIDTIQKKQDDFEGIMSELLKIYKQIDALENKIFKR